MNVLLIGNTDNRSRVGRQLADSLWMDFVDFDAELASKPDQDAGQLLARVGARDNQVVCVGGRALTPTADIAALKRAGRIVWLRQGEQDALDPACRSAPDAELDVTHLSEADVVKRLAKLL